MKFTSRRNLLFKKCKTFSLNKQWVIKLQLAVFELNLGDFAVLISHFVEGVKGESDFFLQFLKSSFFYFQEHLTELKNILSLSRYGLTKMEGFC